ncbi:histidine phosphatase family protein [Actinomadura flavalba]|uniref:histidine phosphatase family protein n=1 Tax=Actinomadura flavalba TaxID=1120938 RepID=UPI00035CC5AF|nr:histidine phosphatase family protein [Actinomadura flavalba]
MNAFASLTLARHGESTGNVAHHTASAADAHEAGIAERDADIPLSDLGRAQAAALGARLAALPAAEHPTLAITSPYLRARETLRIALDHLPDPPPHRVDERLRDRDQGAWEGLTVHGIRSRYPEESARLRRVGKFYFRPPGGESWCDLALRLRSFYRDLADDAPGEHVLVTAHDAIIVMSRYVVEDLTEAEILQIEKTPVVNASVSHWQNRNGHLTRTTYNDHSHLSTHLTAH